MPGPALFRARPRRPPVVRPPHRPVRRRRAQQPRGPLLPEGHDRRGGRRILARARDRLAHAGGAGQPRDRLPRNRLLRRARRRAAGAPAPQRRTTARPAGNWGAPTPPSVATTSRRRRSRKCWSARPPMCPPCIHLGLAEKARGRIEAAGRLLCPGRGARSRTARSRGSTRARRSTIGASTRPPSTRSRRRSRATPTTPRRTTCSRSSTATWGSTRRRSRPPSAPSRSIRRCRGPRPISRSSG